MNILRAIIARIADTPQHAVDAVGIKSSAATTYGATVSSILASVAGWNWTAIITGAVAILGLLVQVYFQIRRDRRETRESRARDAREAAESAARIEALRSRCDP